MKRLLQKGEKKMSLFFFWSDERFFETMIPKIFAFLSRWCFFPFRRPFQFFRVSSSEFWMVVYAIHFSAEKELSLTNELCQHVYVHSPLIQELMEEERNPESCLKIQLPPECAQPFSFPPEDLDDLLRMLWNFRFMQEPLSFGWFFDWVLDKVSANIFSLQELISRARDFELFDNDFFALLYMIEFVKGVKKHKLTTSFLSTFSVLTPPPLRATSPFQFRCGFLSFIQWMTLFIGFEVILAGSGNGDSRHGPIAFSPKTSAWLECVVDFIERQVTSPYVLNKVLQYPIPINPFYERPNTHRNCLSALSLNILHDIVRQRVNANVRPLVDMEFVVSMIERHRPLSVRFICDRSIVRFQMAQSLQSVSPELRVCFLRRCLVKIRNQRDFLFFLTKLNVTVQTFDGASLNSISSCLALLVDKQRSSRLFSLWQYIMTKQSSSSSLLGSGENAGWSVLHQSFASLCGKISLFNYNQMRKVLRSVPVEMFVDENGVCKQSIHDAILHLCGKNEVPFASLCRTFLILIDELNIQFILDEETVSMSSRCFHEDSHHTCFFPFIRMILSGKFVLRCSEEIVRTKIIHFISDNTLREEISNEIQRHLVKQK